MTNEALNILLVSHFLPPRRRAGTENYTLALAKALTARGNRVTLLCAEDWESGENYWNGVTEDALDGIPVHRIHLNWSKAADPNRVLYDSRPVEEWLDRFLRMRRPDVLHATSLMTLGAGVVRASSRANIPCVLTLMDFWFLCPSVQLLKPDKSLCDGNTSGWTCQACLCSGSRLFRATNLAIPAPLRPGFWDKVARTPAVSGRRGLRGMLLDVNDRKRTLEEVLGMSARVIAHSRFLQGMYRERTPVPVEFLPPGHDLAWLSGYRGKTESASLRFGYIGQIVEIKGVHLLTQAFRMAGLGGCAELHVWGDLTLDAAYAGRLQRESAAENGVFFHGAFDRGGMARVFEGIDVLVVPSLWYENAPLAIQEAYATRTPVIATDLGGMKEMVAHESTGLLFGRGDAAGLAAQMSRLARDRALLERLRANAPAVKTSSQEAGEVESIYRALGAGRRTSPVQQCCV
ncbi:MAG: glycosyltransferase family 4 protein [Bryobacterales bacterium]|nr:glycosyltransferase family 4 protein [Bryobacterales bacterium]